MKLSEITKKEFIQGFKDPNKRLVQKKIKELRIALKPLEWKIRSSYNVKKRTVTLAVYPEEETLGYDLRMDKIVSNLGNVKVVIRNIFPKSNDYSLYLGWQSYNNDYLSAEIIIA